MTTIRLSRMMALALIPLLVLGLALPAAAQGSPLVNCNGLSEADCAILQDAAGASATLRSFTMPAWSIRLELNAGAETLRFASQGSARIVLPPSLLALASDMPQDPTDTAALIAFIRTLNAPQLQDIVHNLGLSLAIAEAEILAPGQHLLGSGDVLLKDAGVYLHLFAPTGAEAWFGEQIGLDAAALQALASTVQALQDQLAGPELQQNLEQIDALNAALAPLRDILTAHISTSRGPDAELHGQPVAVFTTRLDLKGFLSDPALAQAVLRLVQDPQFAVLLGGDLGSMGQANAQQVQLLLFLAGTLLGQTSASATLWVGLEDGYFHKLAFDVMLDVDLRLLGDATVNKVTGGLAFAVELDEINTTTLADVIPPAAIQPLEATAEFLAGAPALIEATLATGSRYTGSLASDSNPDDLLALPLTAGESVALLLEAEDYAYVDIFGPDGFLVQTFDTYFGTELPITAQAAGTYLVRVRAYWDVAYALAVEGR